MKLRVAGALAAVILLAVPGHGKAADRVVKGTASHVGTAFGRFYLALPEHRWGRPGLTVRICGPARCITRTSTDAGPNKAMQRAGRVADLNAWDFQTVCGCSSSRGLVAVTVKYLGTTFRPQMTPPPTTTETGIDKGASLGRGPGLLAVMHSGWYDSWRRILGPDWETRRIILRPYPL